MKNSKEWFSVKELMDENLNLPLSDKGIVKKAERENWKKRQREGVKGKTYEYHYSSFPPDVRKQLGFDPISPITNVMNSLYVDRNLSHVKVLKALEIIEKEVENLSHDSPVQFKLSDEELCLIENFRLCNSDRKMILIASAETLANQTQKEQKESSEPLTDRKIA